MENDEFFRKKMKGKVAKGDLNIENGGEGRLDQDNLTQLIDYQYKINKFQYIMVAVMMLLGIAISFINKDGIGITIGSLIQEETTVSDVTVNLGALLILGSLLILINITKNSNTNFKSN